MAAQRRLKMINFDLSIAMLEGEFGQGKYHKGYSRIQRFFGANGFKHHQYSGYLSDTAMSYAEVYDLVLDKMVSELPWLIGCVKKFDATNVTSQSNMLSAIKKKAERPAIELLSLLEGDGEVTL
jgi:virulence-associated protein VapD